VGIHHASNDSGNEQNKELVATRFIIYNHNPNVHEIPTMKQTDTLHEMHDQLTQEGREPAYLIFNEVHYNPTMHGTQGELVLREDMPEWVASPPKRKRAEQTQAETGVDSEDDGVDHGREDETRRKRAKTMIQTAENEKRENRATVRAT
jgi:hypothetical protein